MRAIGVHDWSLPAWAGRLPGGGACNTCPSAGICQHVCCARHDTYAWQAVRAEHCLVSGHRDGMSRVIGTEWPVVCVMLVER
ncbi:hypothetical protein [Saccharopolyspora sp. NPDC049357]|uniref:GP88 family protein n=1 Tax=Saccharopolyspora sp. NPDC049357 TaxID=3154507 RepID=UPI0034201FA1